MKFGFLISERFEPEKKSIIFEETIPEELTEDIPLLN
jgi:hypothetical protein